MRLSVFFWFKLKCFITGNINKAFYLFQKRVTAIASFEEKKRKKRRKLKKFVYKRILPSIPNINVNSFSYSIITPFIILLHSVYLS